MTVGPPLRARQERSSRLATLNPRYSALSCGRMLLPTLNPRGARRRSLT